MSSLRGPSSKRSSLAREGLSSPGCTFQVPMVVFVAREFQGGLPPSSGHHFVDTREGEGGLVYNTSDDFMFGVPFRRRAGAGIIG